MYGVFSDFSSSLLSVNEDQTIHCIFYLFLIQIYHIPISFNMAQIHSKFIQKECHFYCYTNLTIKSHCISKVSFCTIKLVFLKSRLKVQTFFHTKKRASDKITDKKLSDFIVCYSISEDLKKILPKHFLSMSILAIIWRFF